MNYLITFLGKGGNDSIEYSYNDKDIVTIETKFLWHQLATSPKCTNFFENSINKIFIFGTKESNWGELYSVDEGLSAPEKSQKKRSINNVFEQEDDITQTKEWTEFENYLNSQNYYPVIIERGENQQQQINILKAVYNIDDIQNSQVSIDVTHGLRHLPMLGIVIALYLKQTRNVTIDRVFYGAYDLQQTDDYRGKPAPIIDLTGLLQITDWIKSLQTFEKDGDFGVFSELLKHDGFSEKSARTMKEAAFSEKVLHLTTDKGAVERIQTVFDSLTNSEITGISKLFKATLIDRLDWVREKGSNEKDTLYKHQKTLANQYLENGNYLHAVIFGLEAVITQHCEDDKYTTYQDRNKAKGKIKGIAQKRETFEQLDSLRNHLAHASTTELADISDNKRKLTEKNREALKNENSLKEFIQAQFEILLD